MSLTPRTIRMRYPSVQAGVDFFRSHFGPTKEAFESVEPAARDELASTLEKLLADSNVSGDSTVVAPWKYLEVIVSRPSP